MLYCIVQYIISRCAVYLCSMFAVPNSGNILENLLDDDNEIVKVINEQDCLTFTDELKLFSINNSSFLGL